MKPKKIIIVTASAQLRDFFKLEALNFDFSVDCIEKLDRSHNDLSSYDLAIIDKDTIKQTPLNTAKKEITVSAKSGTADITYPCLISELRAIYNGLYSRPYLTEHIVDNNVIQIIFYKEEKNTVSVNDKKYVLSDAEYRILSLLCKYPENTVLREELQKLFGNESSNISDVYICKLRKKLEQPLGQRLIFTVREKGYKIIAKAEWR